MKKFISHSEKETLRFAKKIAANFKQGILALTGELGAGKTTFTQGFAKGLGIKDSIISPTFLLIRQYKIPNNSKTFFHIDLYRIENPEDLKDLGLEEILSNPDNIVLIEWAEKIKQMLPKNTVKISLQVIDQTSRQIKILH